MISIIDVILLLILAGFVFYGLFFGLIRAVGTFIGVIVGAWLASHFYLTLYSWIDPVFFGFENLGKVLSFLIVFSLTNRLVCFAFYLLDKVFGIISIIPFLKTINRLAGAIFGLAAGALALGLTIFVISRYAILEHWLGQWLLESNLAPKLLQFTKILMPVLSDSLITLKGLI